MAFRWNTFSKRLTREFAKAAGLRVARAAEELAARYGEPPTELLVIELWPMLRDRWLATRPGIRALVVSELRSAGLGDDSIEIGTKAGQAEYLRSCRVSKQLKAIVLAAFLEQFEWRPRSPGSVNKDAFPARARDALESIADNVAFIRGELSGLEMPDEVRADVLAACARFDPVVKKVLPGDSASAVSFLWEVLAPFKGRAELYEFGKEFQGLRGALEGMHAVVMRLGKASRRDPRLGIVSILITESMANVHQAYRSLDDATERRGTK